MLLKQILGKSKEGIIWNLRNKGEEKNTQWLLLYKI